MRNEILKWKTLKSLGVMDVLWPAQHSYINGAQRHRYIVWVDQNKAQDNCSRYIVAVVISAIAIYMYGRQWLQQWL